MYVTDVIVTYQVLPEKSAWLYANVSDIKNLVGDELVASAIKSAMAGKSVGLRPVLKVRLILLDFADHLIYYTRKEVTYELLTHEYNYWRWTYESILLP